MCMWVVYTYYASISHSDVVVYFYIYSIALCVLCNVSDMRPVHNQFIFHTIVLKQKYTAMVTQMQVFSSVQST